MTLTTFPYETYLIHPSWEDGKQAMSCRKTGATSVVEFL